MHTVSALALSIVGLYAVQRFLEYRRAVAGIGNFPGYRQLFSPASLTANIVRRIRGGMGEAILRGHDPFQEKGWDALTRVTVFPSTETFVELADAGAIKEITTYRARFPKPVHQYKILQVFGGNIVASEDEEWKRYRKISAPAFSEKNNKLVWDETVLIMLDMFENVWKHAPEYTVDHCIDVTLPIALFVIGVAGFGRRVSWTDDNHIPAGHTMTFKESLHIMSTDILLRVIFPRWATRFSKKLRHVYLGYDELDRYMFEMIESRRSAEKKEDRSDLFSSLMDAADEDSLGSSSKITDRELVGNTFIFLLAGHETTAHTLCFCFAYLALYPEEQEKLFAQIKTLMPDSKKPPASSIPAYEEMGSFTYSMAVFYETLRLQPPVTGIPKMSAEDTSVTVTSVTGERAQLPIPKSTRIVINTPALHRNPRYWSDPLTFKPERFLDPDWPRDAFVPFSAGPRACIGRRFFETEGIAILTMLISQYKVEIKDEPQFAGESFDERKSRVLASKPGLTTTPVRVPLTFKRRY
ncbi:cytochrome P450 [Peniophora sp. CONT]|nr:cytochrome P450 [Peniophora sp. CONT]